MLQSIEIDADERAVIINGVPATPISGSTSPTGQVGICRGTFFTPDYVVKIGGIGEAKLFIEPQDLPFFAEVVLADINRRWLIQKRVNCAPNQSVTVEDWNSLVPLLRKYDVTDVTYKQYAVDSPRTPHNWTVDINGNPVIFDYDFNPSTGDYFHESQTQSVNNWVRRRQKELDQERALNEKGWEIVH